MYWSHPLDDFVIFFSLRIFTEYFLHVFPWKSRLYSVCVFKSLLFLDRFCTFLHSLCFFPSLSVLLFFFCLLLRAFRSVRFFTVCLKRISYRCFLHFILNLTFHVLYFGTSILNFLSSTSSLSFLRRRPLPSFLPFYSFSSFVSFPFSLLFSSPFFSILSSFPSLLFCLLPSFLPTILLIFISPPFLSLNLSFLSSFLFCS